METQKTRPKILTLVAFYLPGYKSGGPVRTIANMVEQLGDELDFWIIASDRDSFDVRPYPNVKVNEWNKVGKARVYYASPKKTGFNSLYRLIRATPHDVLYLNSFFNPRFAIIPLVARRLGLLPARPVILAPRGEFSPGAFKLKRRKKACYLRLAKATGLCRDIIWQASSQREAEDIQTAMGSVAKDIHVAPDLPAALSVRSGHGPRRPKQITGPLRIVFLSRITPKKNLDFALRVLKDVTVPVEFNIYGIVDDTAYWKQCQKIMAELPPSVTARYHGPIDHEIVGDVLAQHDLFFLPTRGENYGHAIFEALAAGVPALISDQTPWQDLDSSGVGWVRKLDNPTGYKQVIEEYHRAKKEEKDSRREKAIQYAQRISEREDIKLSNLSLFFKASRER